MSRTPSAPGPRSLVQLGLLCGLALALHVLEAAAPRPLPWMKLGLSNVAVLLALVAAGPRAALAVGATKVLVGGLLSGGLAGPASLIGGGATAASLLAMALPRRLAPRLLSPVGLSVVGASVHQASQLALARIYVAHGGLYSLLPLALLTGVVSGALTGLVVLWVLRRLVALGQVDAGPAGAPRGSGDKKVAAYP